MPRYAWNKAPQEVKRRYFELIRQGCSGAAASARVTADHVQSPVMPYKPNPEARVVSRKADREDRDPDPLLADPLASLAALAGRVLRRLVLHPPQGVGAVTVPPDRAHDPRRQPTQMIGDAGEFRHPDRRAAVGTWMRPRHTLPASRHRTSSDLRQLSSETPGVIYLV